MAPRYCTERPISGLHRPDFGSTIDSHEPANLAICRRTPRSVEGPLARRSRKHRDQPAHYREDCARGDQRPAGGARAAASRLVSGTGRRGMTSRTETRRVQRLPLSGYLRRRVVFRCEQRARCAGCLTCSRPSYPVGRARSGAASARGFRPLSRISAWTSSSKCFDVSPWVSSRSARRSPQPRGAQGQGRQKFGHESLLFAHPDGAIPKAYTVAQGAA